MKFLPPAIAAQVASGRVAVRYMLLLAMPSGPEGFWSGDYAVSHGGHAFVGLGGAMQIAEIPGSAGLAVDQMEVTVSGFTSAINDLMAAADWHQAPATVFRAFLDDAGGVAHVDPIFSGFLDQAPVSSAAGQAYTVTLILESSSRELDRANGRVRSDADQRTVDPTDAFYSFKTAVAATKEITWGRAGPRSPV